MVKTQSFAILKGDTRQEILCGLLEKDGHSARLIDAVGNVTGVLEPHEIVVAPKLEDGEKFTLRENGLAWVEYMEEGYVAANAVITAENALQVAMEHLDFTLNQSRVLVIGFGRIGKALSAMLKGLGSRVAVSARKGADLALIAGYGMEALQTDALGGNLQTFDVIFNTAPHLVLGEARLARISGDALVIDLASKPGGVDFAAAQRLGIHTIHALALPGKLTPVSAARTIRDTVYMRLEEGDMTV